MSASDDERQLIKAARRGDARAFRSLVERHMKQVYNVAFGFVRDHDDAEDLAQETFVRAYQALGQFRGDSGLSTWLYRIVTNLSLNRIRQRKNKTMVNLESVGSVTEATLCMTAPPAEPDLAMHIERALHELPTLQRATVILRHLNGLSTKQVGGILGCSEGSVKTHLHRGLKKMKSMLNYLEDERD